jgi:hypothetical protein
MYQCKKCKEKYYTPTPSKKCVVWKKGKCTKCGKRYKFARVTQRDASPCCKVSPMKLEECGGKLINLATRGNLKFLIKALAEFFGI